MATKVQGAKSRQVAAVKEQEILDAVKDLTFDTVSDALANAQVEVQEQLAQVSAKLAEQLQVLRKIEGAIRLKKEELKGLHQIEATSSTLDDLNAQIEKQRVEWDEEQSQQQRKFAEQRSERNKAWSREEEEYQYRISQEHKKLEDAFKALMGQQEKENREKQEKLEKQWGEREGDLKKREQELADLRQFKDTNDERIKKEVNGAVAVATNSVKKEYETKMVLAGKDSETEKKLADQTISSLNQHLARQQQQLDELKSQLERAVGDIKEISTKAVESASDRRHTEALQRLMEGKEQTSAKSGK
jgi:uncharacterized coiled-coil protein SlyX